MNVAGLLDVSNILFDQLPYFDDMNGQAKNNQQQKETIVIPTTATTAEYLSSVTYCNSTDTNNIFGAHQDDANALAC